MSFLSVLKKIGHGIQVGMQIEQSFAPVLALTPIGPIMNTITGLVVIAEQAIPQSGAGPIRKEAVVAMVNKLHPGLDQAQLSIAIDSLINTLNALHSATPAPPDPTPPAAAPSK